MLLVAPESASAAIVGTQTVNALNGYDSSNKSATATCPAGKRVLGAGGQIEFGGDQVLLDDIRPDPSLTSVTVHALEYEAGTSANWGVYAWARCAAPPPGLERVSATSPLNSGNKSVSVSCPAGKRVLGAGGDINTLNGRS